MRAQKELFTKILKQTAQDADVILEDIAFVDNFAKVTALVPIDTAVGNFIEDLINSCNTVKKIWRFHYLITNTKRPTTKEITEYLSRLWELLNNYLKN